MNNSYQSHEAIGSTGSITRELFPQTMSKLFKQIMQPLILLAINWFLSYITRLSTNYSSPFILLYTLAAELLSCPITYSASVVFAPLVSLSKLGTSSNPVVWFTKPSLILEF